MALESNRDRWNEPNLRPTKTKRQHYVPRLYLRPFVGEDQNIRVVDLDTTREYRASINNVALETSFYDLDVGGQRLSAEDWLSGLEGDAAPTISRLIADPESIASLNLEEELFLARFVAALRFRTPAFRRWEGRLAREIAAQIKEMGQAQLYHLYKDQPEAADELWEEWKDRPDHWWLGEQEPHQPAAGAVDILAEVQGFANLLRAMHWRTGRVQGASILYTSDNPVAGYLSPVRPWWDGGAFSSFTYYLPLGDWCFLQG